MGADKSMATIFILDDYEPALVAMQTILELAGHDVLTGKTGVGVAERVKSERPDILITDVFMPDQDGIGLINEIRRFDKTLPIIAVSGVEPKHVDYLSSAKRLGADAILHKPFRKEELLYLIDTLPGARPA